VPAVQVIERQCIQRPGMLVRAKAISAGHHGVPWVTCAAFYLGFGTPLEQSLLGPLSGVRDQYTVESTTVMV
jgi:hypothetical protein